MLDHCATITLCSRFHSAVVFIELFKEVYSVHNEEGDGGDHPGRQHHNLHEVPLQTISNGFQHYPVSAEPTTLRP